MAVLTLCRTWVRASSNTSRMLWYKSAGVGERSVIAVIHALADAVLDVVVDDVVELLAA